MLELLLTYKYFIIFPLAVIEGPFVMMVSGFLVKLGYLNFILSYALLVTGDWLADMGWYGVGYKFGMPFIKKFGKFLHITEQNIEKIKKIFHKYHSTILFSSKITMGLGFALGTLITAGLSRVPLKWFAFWNALGGLLWTAGLMAIGFYLGHFYLKVNSVLGKMGVLSLFIVVFMVLISVAHYVRKELLMKKNP